MGEPMLTALHTAGFTVSGFDIRDPSSYGLIGPHITNSPDLLPNDTTILITVVRDIPQTESLCSGRKTCCITCPP